MVSRRETFEERVTSLNPYFPSLTEPLPRYYEQASNFTHERCRM